TDLIWFQLVAFGATGALFSVLLNQQKIPIDLDYSVLDHLTAGVSRILVGVIASMGCYTAIKGGIILSMAEGVTGYGVLFFCFLSGFSETFVPSLLKEKDSAPRENVVKMPNQGIDPPPVQPPLVPRSSSRRRRRK